MRIYRYLINVSICNRGVYTQSIIVKDSLIYFEEGDFIRILTSTDGKTLGKGKILKVLSNSIRRSNDLHTIEPWASNKKFREIKLQYSEREVYVGVYHF